MQNGISPKRGRPKKIVDPDSSVVHVRLGSRMIDKIDREWHRLRLATRADAIRVMLDAFRSVK